MPPPGRHGARAEPSHQRANAICVEAINIARRDGRNAAERAQIYQREVDRLMSAELANGEPAYREPQQPRGFLFRF